MKEGQLGIEPVSKTAAAAEPASEESKQQSRLESPGSPWEHYSRGFAKSLIGSQSRASTSPWTLSRALRAFFGSFSLTSTGTLASPTRGSMPTRTVSFLPNST